jgi:membrane-associated protein
MELLRQIADLFLHLDKHLDQIIRDYGAWTYVILFLVVFCETGLVVTPFLPGDSLLFAVGVFAGRGALDVWLISLLLSVAAILGDTVNYWAGMWLGPKVFSRDSKLLNKKHLLKAQAFYERYGGKTIIIARFVPIVRTFAPFVAGIGRMNYGRFIAFNVVGGLLWVLSLTFAGYWFGEIEFVKKNFSLVVVAIVVISILPAVIEVIRARREAARQRGQTPGG